MAAPESFCGRKLGHHRLLAKVGAGGMGEVYRAHDEKLGREVALKVLPATSLMDAEARARLLREARTASQLNHPHICTIHEVGEAEGQAYIVMELVAGEALNARVSQGALPADEVVRLGLQLAEALAHAHQRGVIHRDFKSANVVLTPEHRVKVLDFGLAKRLPGMDATEATQSVVTQTGMVAGTPAYMAPEQLRGQAADARSDLWALGVVLYEMAAGRQPFGGSTGYELSSAIMNQKPAELPSSVPLGLRAIIERCLEKSPERRYQTAAEVQAALAALHTGTRVAVPWRYRRMPRWWLPAAAALGMVLLALAVFDAGGLRSRMMGPAGPPRIASLAVLPLENLSGDAGQEYFADGMTDELIAQLGGLQGLRVIARGSVMRYKGTRQPLAEIARELNVQALITGTVLRSGERVRIAAELVDPRTQEQLWARRYERDLKDILALQNELTRAIAEELRATLSPADVARRAATRAVNPEAYEALLRSRFHGQKLTAEDFELSRRYIDIALEKDPEYAPAYAALATRYGGPAHMGFVSPRAVADQAKQAARRAVELDPTLPQAYSSLATWTFYLDWDWAATEKYFRQAGELGSDASVSRADLHLLLGRNREAEKDIRRALALDPLNSWTQVAVGGRMLRLGLYPEGLRLLEQVARAEPNMGLARRYLWTAYHNQGRYEEARAQAVLFLRFTGYEEGAQALESAGSFSYPAAMGRAADALAERFSRTYVQPSEIARLYLYAGDTDRAFAWLDRAYEERDTWLTFINNDPRFDQLHSDARFKELLRRLNIPS